VNAALVLDFGGVISRTLFETHAVTERALGLPAGSLTWRGPFDPEGDALWRDMQAERISERDYWLARTREVGRLLGEDWTRMDTFVRRARGADPAAAIRPEAVAAIEAARAAGCRLAVLSNELDLFYGADFRARLPLLSSTPRTRASSSPMRGPTRPCSTAWACRHTRPSSSTTSCATCAAPRPWACRPCTSTCSARRRPTPPR